MHLVTHSFVYGCPRTFYPLKRRLFVQMMYKASANAKTLVIGDSVKNPSKKSPLLNPNAHTVVPGHIRVGWGEVGPVRDVYLF